MPEGAEEGIVKGMYLLQAGEKAKGRARRHRACSSWAAAPSCAR